MLFMPNEKFNNTIHLSFLERLPELVWWKIMPYLDLKSKHQLRLSSKTNKKKVDDHFWNIHFKKQAQFRKFIENPPPYPYIKNLHLSSDVTNFLFPYSCNPYTSNFSFFSDVKIYFPPIENIYLELRHLYMLLALTTDPMFSVNYKLIKKITFIPNKVSLLTKEGVKKTKINYSDILLSNLSHTVEIENYYNNRYPTRET